MLTPPCSTVRETSLFFCICLQRLVANFELDFFVFSSSYLPFFSFLTYRCFKLLHVHIIELPCVFLGLCGAVSSLMFPHTPLRTPQHSCIYMKINRWSLFLTSECSWLHRILHAGVKSEDFLDYFAKSFEPFITFLILHNRYLTLIDFFFT